MRTSSYNILVNVDSKLKLFAILNGYTRAFDIENEDVYNFLKSNGSIEQISMETKDNLIKRGYLTSLTQAEEIRLVKYLFNRTHENTLFKKYNFHFILSYDCNLRCIYCYENPILNGSHCLPKAKISKEYIDRAFEIISEKIKDGSCSRTIALYGGEPFLADNYDMICYIVKKGKENKCNFSVTTNGYDIDKYLDFLKDNKIFSFQITLDGVEDVQNERKPHYKNNDSFTKITENIDALLKLGFPVAVRINTDSYTISRLDELFLFFKQKGWYRYRTFAPYCALLRKDIEENSMFETPFSQIDLVNTFYEKKKLGKLDEKAECQNYGTYNILKSLLLGKPLAYKGAFCGSQTGNIIFDPLGDIYPCWDVVGISKYKIGRYIPDFHLEDDRLKFWFYMNVSESNCCKCKYALFCGGGCIIGSLRKNGKVKPGNCNNYPQLFIRMIKIIYDEYIRKEISCDK